MMNAQTGRRMDLIAHVRQSIADILFTRIGSRVQREQYGSIIPELIDTPMRGEVLAMIVTSGVYMALATFEPRINLTNVSVDLATAAHARLNLVIEYEINGQKVAEQISLGGNA